MKEDRSVECTRHGKREAAFVCQHLVAGAKGPPLGFHAAAVDPDNRSWGDLNGWCDACDDVYILDGGWTKAAKAFTNIKVVCAGCFHDLQARHGA